MTIQQEMISIYQRNGNRLSAVAVVDYAKQHKKSAIYQAFEEKGLWDDETAAEIARLNFGRQLIRSYRVTLKETPLSAPVRGYVSLTSNRKTAQPSYQLRTEVMRHEKSHAEFEMDVVRELRSLQRRFADVLTDTERYKINEVANSVESRANERMKRVDDKPSY